MRRRAGECFARAPSRPRKSRSSLRKDDESRNSAAPQGPPILWLLAAAVTALALCLAFISAGIVHQAELEDIHSADAIVVFGAAEYSGRPSPVLRARLDHAFDLYRHGLAPVIITTGGSGGDPSYNEGQVGHDYLMHRGVPEPSLIAENARYNTAELPSGSGNHAHESSAQLPCGER